MVVREVKPWRLMQRYLSSVTFRPHHLLATSTPKKIKKQNHQFGRQLGPDPTLWRAAKRLTVLPTSFATPLLISGYEAPKVILPLRSQCLPKSHWQCSQPLCNPALNIAPLLKLLLGPAIGFPLGHGDPSTMFGHHHTTPLTPPLPPFKVLKSLTVYEVENVRSHCV